MAVCLSSELGLFCNELVLMSHSCFSVGFKLYTRKKSAHRSQPEAPPHSNALSAASDPWLPAVVDPNAGHEQH